MTKPQWLRQDESVATTEVRMRRCVVLALAGAVLAGCASSQPKMTRDEWLRVASRDYPGVSEEQAYAAAERLFRLADGDDFRISHSRDGMYATRKWLVYVVLAAASGTDYWKFSTERTDFGIRATIQVSNSSQPIGAVSNTNGGFSAYTGPISQNISVEGTAIYDLFWARMDYLLGRSSHWMTCGESNDRISKKIVWGTNEMLCNSFNVKDNSP